MFANRLLSSAGPIHVRAPHWPVPRAGISLERILDRMTDITASEEHHGPAEERQYNFEPTFIMRGLSELHIEFTSVG